MHEEPSITVNGTALTPGQAMTLRVAMESFAGDLSRDGLGDDDHGRAMTKAYLENVAAIRRVMGYGPT